MWAKFSPVFLGHLQALADLSALNANALLFSGQGMWDLSGFKFGWTGDPLDITGFNAGFNRDDLGVLHTEILATAGKSGGGRISDSIVVKAQVDWLGGNHRARSLRNATTIRCALLATGRNIAHGDGNGVFYGGILACLQNTAASGYNGSDPGEVYP